MIEIIKLFFRSTWQCCLHPLNYLGMMLSPDSHCHAAQWAGLICGVCLDVMAAGVVLLIGIWIIGILLALAVIFGFLFFGSDSNSSDDDFLFFYGW